MFLTGKQMHLDFKHRHKILLTIYNYLSRFDMWKIDKYA